MASRFVSQICSRSDALEKFPPEDELDDLRAFREVILAGWQSIVEPCPKGARRHFNVTSRDFKTALELLPSKSLDTRTDGKPWTNDLERCVTPASLEDLGDFRVGEVVDFLALLRDHSHETLPYHVSVATKSILAVQHELGFTPTEAPFMFVGQRQRVHRVLAVPWSLATQLTEMLPEAKELGPVLVIQMTGRCGSTVLTKAMEWLDIGCQSVSEPEVITDIHEMLERGLCSREEAVKTLRAVLLMIVHQRRQAHPDKPMIVIKNRSLSCCWRHCELLPEALPGVKQLFQWRTIEDVVGSFQAVTEGGTVSATTRSLQRQGRDGLIWALNGSPVVPCMKRMAKTMADDSALVQPLLNPGNIDIHRFAKHGSLGYQTLRCVLCAHAAVALQRKGFWDYNLKYEDLMQRKSACVADLLHSLGWVHLVPNPKILGTVDGDKAFLRDAHSGGSGFRKAAGSTVGGDTKHLKHAAENGAAAQQRENAHLPPWQAKIVRDLLSQHRPLKDLDYNLNPASSVPAIPGSAGGA